MPIKRKVCIKTQEYSFTLRKQEFVYKLQNTNIHYLKFPKINNVLLKHFILRKKNSVENYLIMQI